LGESGFTGDTAMTIGFFPTPYPDELLYSVCARYAERVGYPSRVRVVRELFGTESAAIVDLPKRLNHFLGELPPHDYSFETILAENTVFRFFAHFLPLERLPLLHAVMAGSDGSSPRIHIGVTKWGFKSPATLRFCPECVIADREIYRETYWHRIHHLSGIDVCATHRVSLEDSDAGEEVTIRRCRFISADANVRDSKPRGVDPRFESVIIRMAEDAKWLLEYDGPVLGASVLRERYHNLLLQRRFAYYNGGIKATKLLRCFRAFYSEEFLSALNCRLHDGWCNWLFSILSRNAFPYVQHPLRHLLLISFLGVTIQEVFKEFVEYKPFGAGPWPCHNKASDHFGEPVAECQVIDHPQRRDCPLGIFSCRCGFVYTRFGAESESDRHNSILSYGFVWEERLVTLWSDTRIHLRDVASELGVSQLSVIRHALRLKLPINAPGAHRVGPKTLKRYTKEYRPQRDESIRIHRQAWLTTRKTHPEAKRNELIGLANSTYLWLRRFDETWIESNLPPRQRDRVSKCAVPQLDWKAIDGWLPDKISSAAGRIRAKGPEPVRVSITEIIREIGHSNWITRAVDLGRLPGTAKALAENLESFEDFKIRVVRWAADAFLEKGIRPSRYRLLCAAHLKSKSGRSPRVQKELDIALAELQRKVAR